MKSSTELLRRKMASMDTDIKYGVPAPLGEPNDVDCVREFFSRTCGWLETLDKDPNVYTLFGHEDSEKLRVVLLKSKSPNFAGLLAFYAQKVVDCGSIQCALCTLHRASSCDGHSTPSCLASSWCKQLVYHPEIGRTNLDKLIHNLVWAECEVHCGDGSWLPKLIPSKQTVVECPICRELEKQSYVERRRTVSTAMDIIEYWGSDGKYHVHDPNENVTGCKCSEGHKWTISWWARCPSCDYQERSDQVLGYKKLSPTSRKDDTNREGKQSAPKRGKTRYR